MGTILISPAPSGAASMTVRLHGDMDAAAGVDLRQILLDLLLHSRPDRILIDLKAVTAVDGLVIGALRAACEIAQDVHLLLAIDGGGSPVVDQLIREQLPVIG